MGWMPRRLMLLLACSVLLLAPLIGVQLTTGSGRAHACDCEPPTPTEAFEGASAVFSGRVVLVPADWGSVEISVDTVWKGSIASTTSVQVFDGSDCSYGHFREGKEYLVYAYGRSLSVFQCGGTGLLEHAQEDLQILGEGRAPDLETTGGGTPSDDAQRVPEIVAAGHEPAPRDEGHTSAPGTTGTAPTSGDSFPLPVWPTALLAGIAAAALIIRRWARHREPE